MTGVLWVNSGVVLALHAADEWLTWRGLALGARERNPLARWLMGSVRLSVSTKVAAALVIIGALAVLERLDRPVFWALALFHHAAMAVIVVSNWRCCRDLRESKRHD